MIRRLGGLAILGVLCAGCGETATDGGGEVAVDPGQVATAPPVAAGSAAPGAGADTVPIEGGVATIAPGNTQISFVGSKPDGSSHNGGFREFSGSIEVDPEAQSLKAISVTIATDSIYSDNERLTGHLKTPDFFDVREYPEATFQSTAIEPGDDGYQITGDLTLHGVTSSITFPARVQVRDDGLMLASAFTIDRLAFGMDYQPDGINKDVQLTVAVGAAAARQIPVPAAASAGGSDEASSGEAVEAEAQ